MRIYAVLILAVLASADFAAQGCHRQGSEQKPPETSQAPAPAPQPPPTPAFNPRTIAIAPDAKISGHESTYEEPKDFVITGADEFAKVWQDINRERFPRENPPHIDFSKEMVVAVFMGQQPTAGYSIDIVEATEYADRIEVQIVKHKPAPDLVVAQVVTHPFCLARIEKIDKPVRFIEVSTGETP